MARIPHTRCPYCDLAMRTSALKCDACGVEVRGEFGETMFQRLSSDDLAFLEEYLLADFSIKALSERSGLGYAAIRSRLDRIIGQYRDLREGEAERRAILKRLERGDINAAEAAELISRVGAGE